MSDLNIRLGEERVISMAPPSVHEWGFWQFPSLYRDRNGELYLSFANAPDTYSSYGLPPCMYVSRDAGRTWSPAETGGGLPMPDGRMIRPASQKALPVGQVSLPEPAAACSIAM